MNLPNTLTLLRFALVPVYLFVFFSGHIKLAFFIMVIAGATDILDGYLARSRGQVTDLGVVLDPLADKTMMLAVFISLLISGMIPWEAAIAIFIRDAGMIAGSAFFHFRGKKTVPANTLGKLTTVLYYIAILMVVFGIPYAIPYLWAVIVCSFITSVIYISKFRLLNQTIPK
ncbi:CDP-alcohol phosphatidyltransferase family protein [Paenibacillus sp. J2TS4]|uniref:CDP-alcohol phosphatidyltransferase family protein n=1 Tax=Paenibacillus sp. J2TS4 TaxID=2807194 RepID=UPI001B1E0EC8|nr:CDP-alcohol phosphatidyltransferase family protein [Paenibacillus sp. J2TS4]GIP35575.1 CDP-diacylglycerol--glycerol-3-phosphate 3-phosphatidyltransferase [Paenibacillus sp. J2TS4]